MTGDIMIAAAKAKKHIFTEKVLALTVMDAEEILAAVGENGVQIMISLPRFRECSGSGQPRPDRKGHPSALSRCA
jgi:predicted dehydrogenase